MIENKYSSNSDHQSLLDEILVNKMIRSRNDNQISGWSKLLCKNNNQSTQIIDQKNSKNLQEVIPKQPQKSTISIFDKAKKIQISLKNQMNIFICQIKELEDQYFLEEVLSDPYHPNVLAEKCLEKIKETDYLLKKTIKQIERELGNTMKIKFHNSSQVQSIHKFESLERLKYSLQTQIYHNSTIVAYDISYQDKFLACCYNNTIGISDLQFSFQNKEITHQRQITAIKYYNDDSFNLIVGDIDGFIAKYNTCQKYLYQLHNLAICQILIKDDQSIFTCSLDNTIKLTNIEQFQQIMTINYKCSCFSGFDYSYSHKFIIAPNNFSYLSIWDCTSGQEIITKTLDNEEDQFIAIQLSSDSKKVLVNLFKLYTILLFEIKYDLKELLLVKQIQLHNSVEKCINFQWCLDDTSFIYFHQSYFEIRNLEQKNIPLIFQECLDGKEDYVFKRGFVNKLNKDLNYLVAVFDDEVQIHKKKKQKDCIKQQ